MPAVQETVARVREIDVDKYKYGFFTEIESVKAPKGLNEDIVRFISAKKGEPDWLLEWRLEAYRRWLTLTEPKWANVHYPKIDFQELYYYAAPKSTEGPKSLDEVDPELLRTYERLGIPLSEQKLLAGVDGARMEGGRVAVDADERPGRPQPVRHEARVTACPEGAVDRRLAGRRVGQVDQLAGEDRDVDARHVKKDCQGARSPP